MAVKIFSDSSNKRLHVGRELGRGGEGIVYGLQGDSRWVVKLYHPQKLPPPEKLRLMVNNPPDDPTRAQQHVSIVWVTDLVKNEQGDVLGCVMPKIQWGIPIHQLYNPRRRRQHFAGFTWQYLHRTAYNLAAALAAIHARGYVIGDLNESNVLVQPTALVSMIDTDSFQVPNPNGDTFRCLVGKPEFTAPELQGQRLSDIDRAEEHDRFALGVMIFLLLMEGSHPFRGLGEPVQLPQRIRQGLFPYSLTGPAPAQPPPFNPPFDMLSPSLQRLFQTCFVDGYSHPYRRPRAALWADALREAETELVQCRKNRCHTYLRTLPKCPWCQRTTLLQGRDPFPKPGDIPTPQRPARKMFRGKRFYGALVSLTILAAFFIILLNVFRQGSQQIPTSEYEALVALYTATNGEQWKDNTGWLATRNPCDWYGITCQNRHVTHVELRKNQLVGPIPPEVSNLKKLTTLRLSWNKLSESVPPELGNLIDLTTLDLGLNQLRGPISPNLGNLSKLITLDLQNNQLSGPIPPELGHLMNLTTLWLQRNRLRGTIPPELGHLRSLQQFSLSVNQLIGRIPSELGNLKNLTGLWLYTNRLSGPIPAELGKLVKLYYLELQHNQLEGPIPPELGNLGNLAHFRLSSNQLEGPIPPEFGKLMQLRTLHLDANHLEGPLPSKLTRIRTLKLFAFNDHSGVRTFGCPHSNMAERDSEGATQRPAMRAATG
jgi:Leucine-rich repeat (LRR) protein/serine/threonine protein kinase